jgi:hypothetical protein
MVQDMLFLLLLVVLLLVLLLVLSSFGPPLRMYEELNFTTTSFTPSTAIDRRWIRPTPDNDRSIK